MNTKTMVVVALASASAIVGCVSVEQTRAQLMSNNAAEIQKAENTIYFVATEGRDPTGFVQFTPQQQVEYVALAPNNDLLLKIIDKSYRDEVTLAAANKLDFTKEGLSMEILTKHKDIISKVSRSEESASGSSQSYTRSSKTPSKIGSTGFTSKVFGGLNEQELKNLLGGELDGQMRERVARRLLNVTQDPSILYSMLDGDLKYWVSQGGYDGPEMAAKRLAKLADKINDSKVIVKTLKAVESHSLKNYINNEDERAKLLSRLSGEEAVKYALDGIEHHSVYSWNKNKMLPMNDAIAVTKVVKNPDGVVKIVSAMLAKIASYQKQCKDSCSMSWGKEDTDKANALVKNFPKFDDATVAALICSDTSSWSYFIDSVSVNVAYNVLSGGKAKSAELELALVKKLPKEKIDMAVYNGAKYDETKKAVSAVMPPELKKRAAEAAEKAYASIAEKAKNAAKETFEMDGFYLGMSWEDMKAVFAHHFPELKVNEKDDDGLKLYVSNQKSAFCLADKEKKIYQFNFGKKMLKKWYDYDAQNYAEWALRFGREQGKDLRLKFIEKDATIYEPMDMSRHYKVWFHQVAFQYKDNAKNYRLTYFGEEKDYTCEGGIGGAVLKELAAPKFRYTRGDPGSLRVQVEKD